MTLEARVIRALDGLAIRVEVHTNRQMRTVGVYAVGARDPGAVVRLDESIGAGPGPGSEAFVEALARGGFGGAGREALLLEVALRKLQAAHGALVDVRRLGPVRSDLVDAALTQVTLAGPAVEIAMQAAQVQAELLAEYPR